MFGAFVLLFVAIGVEVGATACLPRADGFHDLGWSLVVLVGYAVSIWLLTIVIQRMPVSVAYALWSGIGTALVALVAVLFLGEHFDWTKAVGLVLVVGGVLVLNLGGAH